MKKIELLSPVGNIDMFYAAVSAGADAVYLGGKNFGARAFANNFTNEEMKHVINYAHIYNVKVYVTINTTIYESEIDDVINYIEFLYKTGVDAVIIQDLGLIKIIKDKFKDLEIHASTQMNVIDIEGLKILKDLGVKRVVLAREVSLKEINKMNIDIEKEIFIHGALCMSYSGQCLLSSVIGKRSGNRGLCAGPCRLEYDLLEKNKNSEKLINTNGKYLLSTKDLCTIEYLDEILKSNVDSLKIEGRMKSVEYVYIVTSIYRKAIDNYYKYGKTNITDKDIIELKKIYNRNFTKGYLMSEDKNNINNEIRPNHMGIEIGKVISKNKNRIKIKKSLFA